VLSFQYSGSWHIVPQLRERIIPLGPYVLQVALFLASSRLNNAAFAYAVPMSVHIVFRSGGVVISLILGRLILGRRYVI
jgi:UDP-xylose/UDP-N-acetylglucosamine transporter B4